MAETGAREDPYRAYNFIVEIGGGPVAGFSEVSGLNGDGDIIEYREGDEKKLSVRKLPGLRKFSNITMKRGMTTNRALWRWRLNIIEGRDDRRNGSVVLLDEERNRVVEWQFEHGWIMKYEGPTLSAKSQDVSIETIEIVHEGLKIVE
jgi:phage tail-like protein